MSSAKLTTDHDEIRRWVEQRGGRPSRVDAEGHMQGGGVLLVVFEEFGGDGDERRSPGTLRPARPTSLHSFIRTGQPTVNPAESRSWSAAITDMQAKARPPHAAVWSGTVVMFG